MARSDITEEGMNGGEPDIACRHAVVTVLLQVIEKSEDLIRVNVVQVQIAGLALSLPGQEAKQQDQAVSIAQNSIGTEAAQPGKMVHEVVPQADRQLIRRSRFHLLPPSCSESDLTRLL
jgi:hypothetical protein